MTDPSEASVRDLRSQTQANLEEPPIYRLPRRVSPYFTKFFIFFGASPNAVTALWFVALLAASLSLALELPRVIAVGLIVFYFILDCVDGEIARALGLTSRLGNQLEQVCHWISGGVLIAGAAWPGVTNHELSGASFVLSAALIGNYAFYFVFYQLMLLMTPGYNYGVMHKLAFLVYLAMPLEVNIILIGTVLGYQFYAVSAWAFLSNVIAAGLFVLYYLGEKRRVNAGDQETITE